MTINRYPSICIAGLVLALANANLPAQDAGDQQPAPEESQLIGVLESKDSAAADKALTCKRLAVHGTGAAVPALAALLPDERLASWARIPLEVIPDPSAAAALREAAGELSGRLLVGVINSIGVRQDERAVDILAKHLDNSDTQVASAAAVALGRIGNDAANKLLGQALATSSGDVLSAVAQGCVLCAEQYLDAGHLEQAVELYDKVRQSELPQQRVLEATRGAILARETDGIPLLLEQLKSLDRKQYALGLTVAREVAGEGMTEALVETLLEETSPARQAALLIVLADRGDPDALPAVLQAALEGPDAVRIAAIGVLKRLGDVSSVPTLLEVALEGDSDLADAAMMSLEGLSDQDVNGNLVERLASAEGKTRQILIELIGKRRIEAVPALLKAASDPDAEIRRVALAALGSTVELDQLSFLIQQAVNPRNEVDRSAAESALRAACIRMPDREACASKVAAAISEAPVASQRNILEILGAMGGPKALQALQQAAKGTSSELQDTASRLLGEWMTVDAAPVLLGLSEQPDFRYQTRALRGYIRLVRQFSMPEDQRAKMCAAAMRIAKRDAERELVLGVLERYPSLGSLKVAAQAAKIPSVKDRALAATLVIAQKMDGATSEVRQLLSEVGYDPVKLEIIKAEYGAGEQVKDVTEVLREHAKNLPVIMLPSSSYNSHFSDPAPGTPKRLKIQYRINGKTDDVSLTENAPIVLPVPR